MPNVPGGSPIVMTLALPPVPLALAFGALVLAVAALALVGLARAWRRRPELSAVAVHRRILLAGAAILGWLAITAALALTGFLEDFGAIPPPLALVVGPPLLFVVALAVMPRLRALVASLSPRTLVYVQSFRIGVEAVLASLYAMGAVPAVITPAGHNFDVLVGLSAPLVAWLAYDRRVLSERLVALWNVAGIAILGVTVVTALGSAPTPLRFLGEGPAFTLPAQFPFVWLPGFAVPFAFAVHVLWLRGYLARRDAAATSRAKSPAPRPPAAPEQARG